MPVGNPRLPYPVSNIGMNHQIRQPGYIVRFSTPWLYEHCGIIANTIGSDGEYQIISVDKNMDKIYTQDFSDANTQQEYKVIHVENAGEVCQRAMSRIGEDWQYDLMSNNCEHFVSQMTTGRRQSSQVRGAVIGGIGGAVIGKQINLSGNTLIDALIGIGAGVLINNALQQSETQITH